MSSDEQLDAEKDSGEENREKFVARLMKANWSRQEALDEWREIQRSKEDGEL